MILLMFGWMPLIPVLIYTFDDMDKVILG